ncbi:hypothetical protein MUS1_13295 [Marinomonas ushuaiensis DSM 15871]|uniref:Uncharacterized protein n=1 Tax=Marinomonas ushuaiensis DSM 15871 TaxID=1122207 RepID=X7E4I6_9GAMM|nr:hypothetical protein MUS1_13295 [Marinomonas ushuaiensis DSM 15871]
MKEGAVVYDCSPEELMTVDIMRDLYYIEMSIHQIQDRSIGFYHL